MGQEISDDFLVVDEFVVPEQQFVLDELRAKMLENNFNLKNQTLAIEVAKNRVLAARADYLPKVTASASVGLGKTVRKSDGMTLTDVEAIDWYAALSLSYNLFNGGENAYQS